MNKLIEVQSELKAPKGQFNSFGKYKYRSCEDILEAVKPLLAKKGLLLTLNDTIVEVGGRVYVKATAMIQDGEEFKIASAYARESETKKGMDDSQITGSASSYARKYALNGLFLIDDTKDADTQNNLEEVAHITKEQAHHLFDLLAEVNGNMDKFCDYMKVEGVEEILSIDYQKAEKALESKRKK